MNGYLLDTHALIFWFNKEKVAYLKPVEKSDWRKQCTTKPKLLVSPDELIKPVEDMWEDYIHKKGQSHQALPL